MKIYSNTLGFQILSTRKQDWHLGLYALQCIPVFWGVAFTVSIHSLIFFTWTHWFRTLHRPFIWRI